MDAHAQTSAYPASEKPQKDHANRVADVALRFNVSERHIWRLIKSKKLEAEYLSARCVRVWDSAITRYRERQRQEHAA